MQTDTYQQRRLEAALLRRGIASSWREFLVEARRQKQRAAAVIAHVHALGVSVDARTLARWTRQAMIETAHAAPATIQAAQRVQKQAERTAPPPGRQVT